MLTSLLLLIPLIILYLISACIPKYVKGGFASPSRAFGAFSKSGKDDGCRIIQPQYINIRELLKNNYYVLSIDDERIKKFPQIHNFYWKGKDGSSCFEVVQPEMDTQKSSAAPIILDIIKYKGRDVRNLDFKQRLKCIKKFCSEAKLESPKYTLFDHDKNFGEQFSKIIKKNTKMMIFKSSERKYFHPKASCKWIAKYLLEFTGIIKNNNAEFYKNDRTFSLYNDEFPLKVLIDTLKGLKNNQWVKIYIKDDVPAVTHVSDVKDKNLSSLKDAQDIWIQMNKGLTVDDFLGKTLSVMKRVHRTAASIKLFEHINNNSSLLDIGSGRGANIMIWKRKKLDVYAVEPYKPNYDKLVKKKKIYNINTLNAGGEEYNKILKLVPDGGVDYITMINSLTFFFKNNKTLDDLVLLINRALKKGGQFIGVVMDGDKLLKWANRDNVSKEKNVLEIDCHPFTIKIYDKHKIYINIDDRVTLVKDQWEFLVDFDLFKKKLNKVGIKLISDGFLDKESFILNECPKWFTKLSRYYIFKKG